MCARIHSAWARTVSCTPGSAGGGSDWLLDLLQTPGNDCTSCRGWVLLSNDALLTLQVLRRVRVDTYSLSKYSSVVQEVGGWEWLQRLLEALDAVARRHGASIANVAQRWVLDRPQARLAFRYV